MMDTGVRVERLTKSFSVMERPAVDSLSLEIEPGAFFSVLGPSGCGKTTLMRCIAGLERPDAGEIWVNGELMFSSEKRINVPAYKRKIGMVFQSYAVWPHMTVFQNVAYPLSNQKVSRRKVDERVRTVLKMVGLHSETDRSATLLSGGQQQRVALARALVAEPSVLLLDEPLSNLDAKLREEMRFELRRLQESLGITALYVTHDQHEAFSMSDTLAILEAGRVIEHGRPEVVYRTPDTLNGARFMGVSVPLSGIVTRCLDDIVYVETVLGEIPCNSRTQPSEGSAAWVCIRPENIRVATDDGAAVGTGPGAESLRVRACVTRVAFQGARYDWWAEANGVELLGHSVADTAEARVVRDGKGSEVTLLITRATCVASAETWDHDDADDEAPVGSAPVNAG